MGPSKGLFTLKKNTFSNEFMFQRAQAVQGIDLYVKVYACFNNEKVDF